MLHNLVKISNGRNRRVRDVLLHLAMMREVMGSLQVIFERSHGLGLFGCEVAKRSSARLDLRY